MADFSRVLAGPLATMALADLGARVVKVERPGSGDDTRTWGPPWSETGAAYFEGVNRSKESVALDLGHPTDLATARELAARCDVLVHNFRPGVMERAGLDHHSVSSVNPRVVYAEISGFGDAPQAARRPGYDFVVQAMGGLMSVTGPADGAPTKVGVALVDVLTGKDAVSGILAALRARDRDGVGQKVSVDLLSSLLGSLVNQAAGYLTIGSSPARMGNQHPSIAPYETLRCRDGDLAVACGNDKQFAVLAALLDRPALATDERFASNPTRVTHRAELVAELEDALGAEGAAAWEDRLTEAGVPAARIRSVSEAFAVATELGCEPVWQLPGSAVPQVRHPVRFSRTGLRPPTAPPELGQHTAGLRAELG